MDWRNCCIVVVSVVSVVPSTKSIIEFWRTRQPFYGTNCNIQQRRFAFDLVPCLGFPAKDYLWNNKFQSIAGLNSTLPIHEQLTQRLSFWRSHSCCGKRKRMNYIIRSRGIWRILELSMENRERTDRSVKKMLDLNALETTAGNFRKRLMGRYRMF